MMMHKLFALLAVVLGAVSFEAQAQEKINIAVLDAQEVIGKTDAAGRARDKLKAETDKAQKKINGIEDELEKKQADLAKKKSVLSADKYAEEENNMRKAVRDYRMQAQSIQEGLDKDNMKLRKEITDEVRKVVAEIAKEKGYSIVMAKNLLVYSAGAADISNEVLKRVNDRLNKKK